MNNLEEPDILISESMARAVTNKFDENKVGATVTSPPSFNEERLIQSLDRETDLDVGVILHGFETSGLEDVTKGSSIRVAEDLPIAVKWRNAKETQYSWEEKDYPDRTVLIIKGDPAKKGSLDMSGSISKGRIRKELCQIVKEDDVFKNNKPSQVLLDTLAGSFGESFSVEKIANYFTEVKEKDSQESIDNLGKKTHLLGLFPQDNLLSESSEVEEKLEENLEYVNRVRNLSKRDGGRLTRNINKAEDKEELAEVVRKLKKFQTTGELDTLRSLQFTQVKKAFNLSRSQDDDDDEKDKEIEKTKDTDRSALELGLEPDESLEETSKNLDSEIKEAVEEGEEEKEVEVNSNTVWKIKDIDSSFYKFCNQFIQENKFGGRIEKVGDIDETIENFNSLSKNYFSLEEDEKEDIIPKLERFADQDDSIEALLDAFKNYKEVRSKILGDNLYGLIFEPFPRLLGDEDLQKEVRNYLESYNEVQRLLNKKYLDLQKISSPGAVSVLSQFLSLDTIVFEKDDEVTVLLDPIHPLHIWRYWRLSEDINEKKEDLSEEEKDFLQKAMDQSPHVLKSIEIKRDDIPKRHLIQAEDYRGLPVYEEIGAGDIGDNRAFYDHILDRFTTTHPPAESNLNITIVDPVSPQDVLNQVKKFIDENEESISGFNLEMAFIETEKSNILPKSSKDKKEKIISLFSSLKSANNFKLMTYEADSYEEFNEHLQDNPKHLVILNDQSKPELSEFERDQNTSIHPLYVPKEVEYDPVEESMKMVNSKEGTFFSPYQELINHLSNHRNDLHEESVRDLSIPEQIVKGITNNSIWTCISTSSTNSNPFFSDNLISKEYISEREYGIYSNNKDVFKRVIKRIFNEYPLAPEDEDLNEIIDNIVDVEKGGLLRLVSSEIREKLNSSNTKGILGSIIAYQWLEERIDDPKIIFSVDDPVTRDWLNLGQTNRRTDFFVVRPDDNQGLELDVVEVKAVDNPDGVKFEIEENSGNYDISGDVVEQIMSSETTISRIFRQEDELTAAPRREKLKEQIYHQIKAEADIRDRQDWKERMKNIFSGEEELKINSRLISIELAEEGDLRSFEALTESDNDDYNNRKIEIDRIPRPIVSKLIGGFVESEQIQLEDDEDMRRDEDQEEEINQEEKEDKDIESEEKETEKSFNVQDKYLERVDSLKNALDNYVDIREIDKSEVEVGPNIVRYKVELAQGEKQQTIERRAGDVAREMALETDPIIHRLKGTKYVAVDIPKPEDEREVIELDKYFDHLPDDIKTGELPFLAGMTPSGNVKQSDLSDAPHMLVGGMTGGGKSVYLHSVLSSMVEALDNEQVKFAMIDPKRVEFANFRDLPNLVNEEIITDEYDAKDFIKWLAEEEMENRSDRLVDGASKVARDIVDYNQKTEDDLMKPIVVVIDEYADLLDQLGDEASEFQSDLRRLTQRARNVGIHLIVATQSPSSQIIDTDLRSNFNVRTAFEVSEANKSRIILGETGAETLAGEGDMLFKEGDKTTRLQGFYIDADEIPELVEKNID